MNKTLQVLGSLLLFACGGCATVTTNDLRSTGGGRTYDLAFTTAYKIALDALEEMKFSIKKDDPSQGEIRAQTEKYTKGIFICEGNLLGIFVTRVGDAQTRVEIQSLYVRPRADLACKDKAEQAISEITQRLRQNSSPPSVYKRQVPRLPAPSQPLPEVQPSEFVEQPEQPKKSSVASLFDFRKTNWGMTKEQVKKAELGHLEVQNNNNVLMYSDKVAGKDVMIGYIFVGDKLVRSKYVFSEKHSNSNLFITDYTEIKEILIEKYGSPIEDRYIWSNELYKSETQYWGMAVGLGHLVLASNWDTPSTSIFHVLRGDNFQISLVTEYASKELHKLEKQFKQDKALSDF